MAKRGSHLNHRNACFRTRFRPHSCTRSVQIYSYRHTLALSSTNPLYPFSLPQLHHSLINLFSEPLCHLLYCRSFPFSLSLSPPPHSIYTAISTNAQYKIIVKLLYLYKPDSRPIERVRAFDFALNKLYRNPSRIIHTGWSAQDSDVRPIVGETEPHFIQSTMIDD